MRNRVIYQSEALFVGPTPSTGNHFAGGAYGSSTGQYATVNNINQLHRVQSCNYSFSIPRQSVNQFGDLAEIDRAIMDQMTVGLDFTYLVTNFWNEKALGFTVGSAYNTSCISGLLNKTQDDKNYFIMETSEGTDANSVGVGAQSQGTNVIGVGNGFLASYQVEAAVGGFPTASVRVEGLNMSIKTGISGAHCSIPAVNPLNGALIPGWYYGLPLATTNPSGAASTTYLGISALRHGDISVNIYQAGTAQEYNDMGATPSSISGSIQSFRISFDLARENLQKLGSRFAYSKEINYPLAVSASVDGLVTDLNTGDLSSYFCNDKSYDVIISMNDPATSCGVGVPIIGYKLASAKLDSQSYSLSIGSNKSFTLDFSSQIGGATQTGVGLFMSGYAVQSL
jgi:hypothetical protein